MAQELATLFVSNERINLLKQALIRNGLIEESVLDNLLKERDRAVDKAKKDIKGICYSIDYIEKKLKVFDTYTQNIIHDVDLPGEKSDYNPDEWSQWGKAFTILNPETFQKDGDIQYIKNESFGLVVKDDKVYLNNSQIAKQELLAYTNTYIFNGLPKTKKNSLPYDMGLSSDNKILYLSNRGEGSVYIFDTELGKFTNQVSIRSAGSSNKAINVAISNLNNKLYITDSITQILYIYDLTSKEIVKKNLGIGILGSICLAPNEKSFYVVTTKPELNLRCFSTDEFKEIKEFGVKGELFSNVDDPCDLLAITPDKQSLYLMTYINEPMPFTPVITVISIEKNKAVKRFSIKDGIKPCGISFVGINPIGFVNKEMEELLMERKLVSINKLRDIKSSILRMEEDDDYEEIFEVIEEKDDLSDIKEEYDFEVETEEEKNLKDEYGSGVTPKKINHIIIPIQANKHIGSLLLGSFWQQTEIDLEEIPEAMEKLINISENIRKKLEYYDLEIVNIEKFHGSFPLKAIIQRATVLEMLEEDESGKRQKVQTAPTNCPNCNAPLLGSWTCKACGFSLEKPEDVMKRKLASFDHLANLHRGHFFVLNPEKGIFYEIDNYKVPVMKITKEEVRLKSITNVIRLKNKNNLVLDRERNTIVELAPKEKFKWVYKATERKNELLRPSGFAVLDDGNILIADTGNHRIIEVNMDCEVVWEYGTRGESGIDFGYLNKPMDIQKTYDQTYLITDTGNNRVLEFTKILNQEKQSYELKIIWQYGNSKDLFGKGQGSAKDELNTPISAFKDLDGKYLILDSGNKRILEVDENKNITWEYRTDKAPSEFRINNPIRVTRLKNQDILIIGDNKALIIMPLQNNEVSWFRNIDDISSTSHYSLAKEEFKKARLKFGGSSRYMGKVGDSKDEYIIEERPDGTKVKRRKIKSRYIGRAEDDNNEYIEEIEETSDGVRKIKRYKSKYIGRAEDRESSQESIQEEILSEKTEKRVFIAPEVPKHLIKPRFKRDAEEDALLEMDDDKNDQFASKFDIDAELKKLSLEHETIVKTRVERPKIDIDTSSLEELRADKVTKKAHVFFAEGEEILNIPITLIDRDYNRFVIYNRHGEPLFTQNCRTIPNFVQVTPNKTVLITQGGEILEVSKTKKLLWKYECIARSAIRLLNNNTLITDMHNNKVMEVSIKKGIVWEYKEQSKENMACYAVRLSNSNVLMISDSGNFAKEVTPDKKIIWTFGEEGKSGKDEKHLSSPEHITRLKNGNTLIADSGNHRVIEVSEDGNIVWSFTRDKKYKILFPTFAKRLTNNRTFIIYSNNKNAIEVNAEGHVVWSLTVKDS